ncbi:MAG: LysR family transcriptional regulator [Amphritea sp.]
MPQIRHLLPQLYCFTIVAKHHSFTLAAQELSISQSAVSYQIKKLEEQLGYTLLLREPRKPIRLTTKGETLLHSCEEIYARLDNTIEEMSGSSLSGELSLTADVCFGTLVVSQALPFIQQRYPKLALRLNLTEEFLDLGSNQIDLAIRSRNDDPQLEYEFLCSTRMMLVASKTYLKSHPQLRKISDLYQHQILCTGDDDFDWQNLTSEIGSLHWHKLSNRLRINNIQALTQAMTAGSGIAYIASYTIAQQLEDGSLQVLLDQQLPELEINYYLAYPPRTKNNPKAKAFREQLQAFIRQSELNRFLQVSS